MTIATVLRSGGVYTAEWVTRLRDQCARHAQRHRFVCFSDVDVPGVEVIPLRHEWPGWWSKAEVFRPDVELGDRVLYLDLDTLVVANIDHLDAFDGFAALSDFYRTLHPASGVWLWTKEHAPHGIYEAMVDDTPVMQSRSDHWWPQQVDGDIYRLQRVFPGTFGSYKADNLGDGPRHYAVVCFHGQPKQHHFRRGWVREAWQ